jgi:hypothetical protein
VRFSRPIGVTLSCAAIALAATACGSSAKSADPAPAASSAAPSDAAGSPAPASGAPSAASSAGPDLSSMTAAQIIKASEQALTGAQSLKLDLKTVDSTGTSESKLATDVRTGCTGTISRPGVGSAEVVMDTKKTIYLKPDDAMWKVIGGSTAATVFHGKWVTNYNDPATMGMIGYCAATQFAAEMDAGGQPTKGQTTTIDGQPAQMLTELDPGGNKNTLWVAAKGQPFPLQATGGNGAGANDKVTMTDYNVPVTVTVPPAAQVVDFAKVKAAAGR